MMNDRKKLRKIEEKYPWATRIAKSEMVHMDQQIKFKHLEALLGHLTEWVDLTMQSAEAASMKADHKNPQSELAVFAINASRWCSLQWSILQSARSGSYGECTVLGRSQLELSDLILVLGSSPEKIGDWIETTGTADSFIPRKWMPSGLRKQVENLTETPYPRDLYSQMSAAIHPSYFGNSYYGNRMAGQENAFVATPEAQFDPIRLMDSLYISITTAPVVLWQFLKSTERLVFPKKKQYSFIDRFDRLNTKWAFMMSYYGGLKEMLIEFDRDRTVSWVDLTKTQQFKDELARRETMWTERVIADLERER